MLNPQVVDGQVHGGVAQGFGNALYEEMMYDDSGPATDDELHALPAADRDGGPNIHVGHVETPSPLNPEGIKGAGEGGTMPVPAAIANAIDDALSPLGVVVDRAMVSPPYLLGLIQQAKAERQHRTEG